MPSTDSILSSACTSGLGKVMSPVSLWQAIASLFNTRSVPTPAPSHTAEVTDWIARVAAAGGATPSEDTTDALDDFVTYIAAFKSKMVNVSCIVPDNLIAAGTPIFKQEGSDTWSNNGFVAGDLGANGIKGASGYFGTGITPNSSGLMTTNTVGISMYCHLTVNEAVYDSGAAVGGGNNMQLYYNYSGTTYFDCWSAGSNRVSGLNGGFQGFMSANRLTNDQKVYRANSVTPFATFLSATNAPVLSRPTCEFVWYSCTLSGPVSPLRSTKRFSFLAVHQGLTAAEAEDLFDAVQALRVALGGGYI